jgi:HD superfamily phosphodiesterase
MRLSDNIHLAEQRFIPSLEEFFISVYDENKLFSHGLDHHRRVWNYAKELLLSTNNQDIINPSVFAEKLIIACYIHDIGMSVDPGIRHGHHSRNLCSQFLKTNLLKESDFQDVLRAIENHDNKEYTDSDFSGDLLTILSVADDLDAFGYIGIYRDLEIYLTRGVDPADAGNQILRNAGKRYENFKSTFGYSDKLLNKHKIRFDLLELFFRNYNRNVTDYPFKSSHPDGYFGIVDIILSIITRKKELEYYLNEIGNYSDDRVITDFFAGLKNELS